MLTVKEILAERAAKKLLALQKKANTRAYIATLRAEQKQKLANALILREQKKAETKERQKQKMLETLAKRKLERLTVRQEKARVKAEAELKAKQERAARVKAIKCITPSGKARLRAQQVELSNAKFSKKGLVPEPILRTTVTHNEDGTRTVKTERLVPLSPEMIAQVKREHNVIKQKQYREKVLATRKRMYLLAIQQKKEIENDTETD